MTSQFPALRAAFGLITSALLATGFIAAATAPAYAGTVATPVVALAGAGPVIAAQTV